MDNRRPNRTHTAARLTRPPLRVLAQLVAAMFIFISGESPLLTAISLVSVALTILASGVPALQGLHAASGVLIGSPALASRLWTAGYILAITGLAAIFLRARAPPRGGEGGAANPPPRLSVEMVARLLHALPIEVWRQSSAALSIGELKARLLHRRVDVRRGAEKAELVAALAAQPSETACSICFEDYADGDDVVRVLRCGHYFHCECIDRWLLSSSHSRAPSCPLCNSSLLGDDTKPRGYVG